MKFIDYARLDALDANAFRTKSPFPWVNPEGLLTDEGFEALRNNMPDVAQFEPVFGKARSHGQQSHDRYALEYLRGVTVPAPWQAFIEELSGDAYRRFLKRMLGCRGAHLRFHWHYTPAGCSVSPHCDATGKFGSHIFYFNTEDDWDPAWGGETVVLDDEHRFDRKSAPAFEDFPRAIPARAIGNRSFLFARTPHSWHGVRPLTCPEGRLRKVFIVVVERPLRSLRRQLTLETRRLAGHRA